MTIFRYTTNIAVTLLFLLIIGLVLMNSGLNIPPGVLLIGGLLIAATTRLVGEYLIKKWTLTDRAASVARSAAAIMALIISIGTIFPFWNGAMPNISWMSALYTYATQDLGRAVQVLAIIMVGSAVIYGAYREWKTGSGDTAIFFWRVAFATIIVLAFLTWLIGTNRMTQVGNVVQNSARTQLDAFLTGQPINFNMDWGYVALGFFLLAFLWGLWKKELIRTATAVVGAIIWLPFIAWLAWGSLPAEYKQGVTNVIDSVSDKASDVYTTLPMVGETHIADLYNSPTGERIAHDFGPNDALRVGLSAPQCTVFWHPTDHWLSLYGNEPWFDPSGTYLRRTKGSGTIREYELTEDFEAGLRAKGVHLQLRVWQHCP